MEQLERSGGCASSWASPAREDGKERMPARETTRLGPAMALVLLTPTGLLRLPATTCSIPSFDLVLWEKEEEQACSLSTSSVHTARSAGLNSGYHSISDVAHYMYESW